MARLLPMKPRPPVMRTSLSLNPSILSLQFPEFCVLHEHVVHGGGDDDEARYSVAETSLEQVVSQKTVEGPAEHVAKMKGAVRCSHVPRKRPRIPVNRADLVRYVVIGRVE